MVLKVEFRDLLDDIVMGMLSIHSEAICPPFYLIRIHLIVIVFVLWGGKPVGVVRWVSLTAIVAVVILGLLYFFRDGGRRRYLLVIRLQRKGVHVMLLRQTALCFFTFSRGRHCFDRLGRRRRLLHFCNNYLACRGIQWPHWRLINRDWLQPFVRGVYCHTGQLLLWEQLLCLARRSYAGRLLHSYCSASYIYIAFHRLLQLSN